MRSPSQFTKTLKIKKQKHHLDVLFRTVSRGSRVPLGQFSGGLEKVREGLEKVRRLEIRLEMRGLERGLEIRSEIIKYSIVLVL